jgi:hypothetical protein
MGLGGYSPAPEFVSREARAAGAIEPGSSRVIATAPSIAHLDFKTLQEARRYADDVVSEGDYENVPPAAHIVDSPSNASTSGSTTRLARRVRVPGSPTRTAAGQDPQNVRQALEAAV